MFELLTPRATLRALEQSPGNPSFHQLYLLCLCYLFFLWEKTPNTQSPHPAQRGIPFIGDKTFHSIAKAFKTKAPRGGKSSKSTISRRLLYKPSQSPQRSLFTLKALPYTIFFLNRKGLQTGKRDSRSLSVLGMGEEETEMFAWILAQEGLLTFQR